MIEGLKRLAGALQPGSGPRVARTFQALLALVFLDAWISLGVQIHVLIGARGLLPIAPFLKAAAERKAISVWEFPTILWLNASDSSLTLLWVVGAAASVAAFLGFRPRACFALCTLLYLSAATACRTFLSFQWDNMLLECGVLVLWLPTDRSAPGAHLLFKLLLFKLYWESGIAKWQSHLHDWHDGSAMTFYYETAPLPTWLGWYAHALPAAWHHIESWGALTFELAVPFLMFGPRAARLTAFGILSGFQFIDAATANYGFFCYLSACLHVFLLDDSDLERVTRAIVRFLPGRLALRAAFAVAATPTPPATLPRVRRYAFATFLACYVAVSVVEGLDAFADLPSFEALVGPVRRLWEPLRLVNTYHLFGHITRERVEPEFQTRDADQWVAHPLWHKPGAESRAPDFVAPHQPRVDFSLWFYGLSFHSGAPEYVASLVDRLCRDPSAVQPLFRDKLPAAPEAVRIVFWQYRFTTPKERAASGAWWKRELLGSIRPIPCTSGESRGG